MLTRPIVSSFTNYGILSLFEAAASEIFPLVWSAAIDLCGLGLSPSAIGLWISAYSRVSAVSQLAFFPRIVARAGPRRRGFR